MLRKFSIFIIFIFVLLGATYFFSKNHHIDADKKIKIGFVMPLTGDWGFIGQDAKDLVLSAFENMPDKQNKYELIFEDYAFDAKKAALAANKLIYVDKVDVMISLFSNAGLIINPIAEENKTMHICVDNVKAVANGKYNFVHGAMEDKVTDHLAKEISVRGNKSATVLSLKDPWAVNLLKEFVPNLQKYNVVVKDVFEFNPGEKDFRTTISKAMNNNPDIYVLLTFDPSMTLLLRQFNERGVGNDKFTGFESFSVIENKKMAEGIWFINMNVPNKEFVEYYKEKIGRTPNTFASYVFNVFAMVDTAYEKANYSPDILNIFNNLVIETPIGKTKVSEDGVIEIGSTIDVVKNGEIETIMQLQ